MCRKDLISMTVGSTILMLLASSAALAQPIAGVDVMYSGDGGTSFADTVTVDQGDSFIARFYFDNTGDAPGTSASVTATLPAGFDRVGGSTRVCLQPTAGETVCNADAGMGGAIDEGSVWVGSTLTIAPSAGLFGDGVNATSGTLEIGKQRFFNLHECHYWNGAFDRFFINGNPAIAGTNVANAADALVTCAASIGPYNEAGSTVSVFDLLGFRYLNYHECHYLSLADHIYLNGTDAAGTNTSNVADGAASCAPAAGAHVLLAGDVQIRNLDLLGKRFLNLHDCRYSAPGDQVVFNARAEAGTNASTVADAAPDCDATSGIYVLPADGAGLIALDLLDATRGQGFVEVELTALNDGIFDITASLGTAELPAVDDTGMITVVPTIVPEPVPAVDLQLAACGQTFSNSVFAMPGDVITARIYFDNTGDLPGTNVSLATDLPAGFDLVADSTRVCLEPVDGEVICNTDAGMGGAIDEASVWAGGTLTISPTAGLFGESVGAASGILETGRKRFLNLHECHYYNGINDRFFINADSTITGTNLANTAQTDADFVCAATASGYSLVSGTVTPIDLLGQRHLNFHECQYEFFFFDRIFINADDAAGTAATNTPDAAAVCSPNAGAHSLLPAESGVGSVDLLGQRFLNLHECNYQNGSDVVSQTATNATGTNASLTADAAAVCSPTAGLHNLIGSTVEALDLLDATRGRGFVEFRMIAGAGAMDAVQMVTMTGNEFAAIDDSANMIESTGAIFGDCFESGDTTRWSIVVAPVP